MSTRYELSFRETAGTNEIKTLSSNSFPSSAQQNEYRLDPLKDNIDIKQDQISLLKAKKKKGKDCPPKTIIIQKKRL